MIKGIGYGAVGGIVAQKSLKTPHEGLLQKSLYPKKSP